MSIIKSKILRKEESTKLVHVERRFKQPNALFPLSTSGSSIPPEYVQDLNWWNLRLKRPVYNRTTIIKSISSMSIDSLVSQMNNLALYCPENGNPIPGYYFLLYLFFIFIWLF